MTFQQTVMSASQWFSNPGGQLSWQKTWPSGRVTVRSPSKPTQGECATHWKGAVAFLMTSGRQNPILWRETR